MSVSNLKDLYVHEIKDLYSANTQSLEMHQTLAEACTSEEACAKMDRVLDGIRDGIKAVETICDRHGVEPTGERCKGMAGLVTEAKAHATEADIEDAIVRDASIISQSNRMEHYALSGYKSCLAYARALDLEDDAKTLQDCVTGTQSSGDALREVVVESSRRAHA
ncbi:MAG: ferritin-like domain-containing protein [Phycisphaerales bacterium]|jgi:ferritin-like metal-binding protein YciE